MKRGLLRRLVVIPVVISLTIFGFPGYVFAQKIEPFANEDNVFVLEDNTEEETAVEQGEEEAALGIETPPLQFEATSESFEVEEAVPVAEPDGLNEEEAAVIEDEEPTGVDIFLTSSADAINAEGFGTMAYEPLSASFGYYYTTYWVSGEGTDSAERFYTSDGAVAYCLNAGRALPTPSYSNTFAPTSRIVYIMAYGYPNITNIQGYSLSADQAQCATQLAIWAANTSGYGRQINLWNLSANYGADGQRVLDAARALYSASAGGFSGGTAPAISLPADCTAHVWAGHDLRYFGPFSVSSAASDAMANLAYSPIPAGGFLGDYYGNPISVPTPGREFWVYIPESSMLTAGSARIEIRAGYQIHSYICWSYGSGYQDMIQHVDPVKATVNRVAMLSWDTVVVAKTDSETDLPIADTEFALSKKNGSGGFDEVLRGTTDSEGKLYFPGLGLGDYRVAETNPALGYQSSRESGLDPYRYFTVTDDPVDVIQVYKDYVLRDWKIEKKDSVTGTPIPDTTFAVYRYPYWDSGRPDVKGIVLDDGSIGLREGTQTMWDIDVIKSALAGDTTSWELTDTVTTNSAGVAAFEGYRFGYYRIVETIPNPAYASAAETLLNAGSSDNPERLICLDKYFNTRQAQVFLDELISIAAQIDKDTINITSAAYVSLPDEEGFSNILNETYHYELDYRSTSNVRADEFTVVDNLDGANDGLYRVQELWTAISWGDSDGLVNVWYKTNMTSDGLAYSGASAMNNNPYNPNNPSNAQNWSSVGWKLWAEGVSTTAQTHLLVSELELAEGEYLTAVRWEHGSVERGFTTRNYSHTSFNTGGGIVDWTPQTSDSFYTEQAAAADGLQSVIYLVYCPFALEPPTEIYNSAHVDIARNFVLTDEDNDEVITQVIGTFSVTPLELTGEYRDETITAGYGGGGKSFRSSGLPQTGDSSGKWMLILVAVLGAALVFIGVSLATKKRRAKGVVQRRCSFESGGRKDGR
jgi:TQXA domain-containing protein/LPXTG-motif cell wall-anchored protein